MSKSRYKYGQLALMNWLLQEPYRFISVSNYGSSRITFYGSYLDEKTGEYANEIIYPRTMMGSNYFENKSKNFLGQFGQGRIDTTELVNDRLLEYVSNYHRSSRGDAFVKKLNINILRNGQYIFPTEKMLAYWNKYGRDAYEAEHAKREAEKNKVKRTVLVGIQETLSPKISPELRSRWPSDMALPFPRRTISRPVISATVIKETPNRLYIEDVKEIDENKPYYYLKGGTHKYIEKYEVIADDVSEATIEKAVAVYQEFKSDIERITIEAMEKMLPLIEDYTSRLKQKEAEYDDLLTDSQLKEYDDTGFKP